MQELNYVGISSDKEKHRLYEPIKFESSEELDEEFEKLLKEKDDEFWSGKIDMVDYIELREQVEKIKNKS